MLTVIAVILVVMNLAAFALMGNVTGWLYRRAVPKRRPASRPE